MNKDTISNVMRNNNRLQIFSLDDFVIKNVLGTGTFGKVRFVTHKSSGKCYAMKIMSKANIIKLSQIEHVNSEIEVMSKIFHPFIANIYGFFQTTSYLYMVMEFVQGGELYTLLRKKERLSNDHAMFYAMEVILCFEYLHNLNIIYRDLKPENLLISTDGHIKITDFGFAKDIFDKGIAFTLCGTPEYLSPEMIQSKGHGYSVDWWTLGILIFEMLVGYPPFFDDNPLIIYSKVLSSEIEFPPKIVSSKAKNVIKKLLKKDRTKRLCCTREKAKEVKRHAWFEGGYSGSSWQDISRLKVNKVPYKPEITDSGDLSHFDDYSNDEEEDFSERNLSKEEQELFQIWTSSKNSTNCYDAF